jgi:GNAT superfamily N-acetyltransferase
MDPASDELSPGVAATSAVPVGPMPAAAGGSVPKPRLVWVPVRSMTSRHRDRVRAHLLELDGHDRYLRFGFAAADAQINHYVDTIDFERDEVFGIFNRRLELIALAHLAYATAPAKGDKAATAEFGVSVSERARRRGLGARLFDHAILHARNRRIEKLLVFALSENTAMLRIARNAGATVERAGSESEAWLQLPSDDFASQMGALVEDQAAEWDYQLKAHARRVHQFIDALTDAPGVAERAIPNSQE